MAAVSRRSHSPLRPVRSHRSPRSTAIRPGLRALALSLALLSGACDAFERPEIDPAVADRPLPTAGTPVDTALAGAGAMIYENRCLACHRLEGDPVVGPTLGDVVHRRNAEWIRGMVLSPDSMLRADPVARSLLAEWRVPMIDTGLDEPRFRAVLEYLRLAAGPSPAP